MPYSVRLSSDRDDLKAWVKTVKIDRVCLR